MNNTYFKCEGFLWDNIEQINYKAIEDGGEPTFRDIKRQNIYKGSDHVPFDIRYFECGPGGFSTLEKHDHVHVVVVLRGTGVIIVDQMLHTVSKNDLVVIPSWAAHQLINTGEQPFGFLCTVNAHRDKPQLLSQDEVQKLLKDKDIDHYIQIPKGYFADTN